MLCPTDIRSFFRFCRRLSQRVRCSALFAKIFATPGRGTARLLYFARRLTIVPVWLAAARATHGLVVVATHASLIEPIDLLY